ncbi:hypothetical protein FXO38_16021 [Capsicum annuum]|uniref:Glycosyltransferase N-terminal domain-containing protein n=1 Tax=Capsicum annuum TaxID=4072 RepID=A0A2G2YVV9_CAPAN|nr:hypothetical protein FXO38_16021 [Capsicum annuum]PHT73745.1 hypothetical protein T459_24530 [Capsicum annuum]
MMIMSNWSSKHELKFHSGEVINSCKEVEGKHIDLLAKEKCKPSWAFGPFHMLLESHDSISSSSSNINLHECLEFLDKTEASSAIFVSFGLSRMNLGSNSTSKASTRGEDYPSPSSSEAVWGSFDSLA